MLHSNVVIVMDHIYLAGFIGLYVLTVQTSAM